MMLFDVPPGILVLCVRQERTHRPSTSQQVADQSSSSQVCTCYAVAHLNSLRSLIGTISPAWLVRDHGQDLVQPAAHHPAAVPSHGLSTVCREGGPGTVPAAGENRFVLCQHFLNQSPNASVSNAFLSFVRVCHRQDANECWLQMVRVLQQKLEPLESVTPMEVRILSPVF